MPTFELTFNNLDYLPSIQVGDIAFYATPAAESGGFQSSEQSDIVTIGEITAISQNSNSVDNLFLNPQLTPYDEQFETLPTTFKITCEISADTPPPTTTDFIFFAKDNRVNMSSVLGYYGSAKFKNNSTVKAEMYSTSCEIDESSK
tara:strand:+ start:402 stop:839 length:438 start_codon:yes stop_codon:yes gene_type:complete